MHGWHHRADRILEANSPPLRLTREVHKNNTGGFVLDFLFPPSADLPLPAKGLSFF